ncbi:MAG: glycogen synthase [Verrucomicrobiota bacterium]|jgi:starch synthase|nr:glycogen synthase [Verrucomicrobiota bacterium]
MRVLQVTSEIFPYSKTGGLADMVAGLSGALLELGEEITVATPLYRGVRGGTPNLRPCGPEIMIPLGKNKFPARWWKTETAGGVTVLFLENDGFYDRDGIYMDGNDGYWDNPERFMLLNKAVAEIAPEYEVVHVHDWQTAFIPMLLKVGKKQTSPRTILTIHNLAYQGQCEGNRFNITNLPKRLFQREGPEFWGGMNFLKAGLHYADYITTVSPTYAREILTQEYGEGLDGVLRKRKGVLTGILNGVDYGEWNTENNTYLPASYSAHDLDGKDTCKKALQKEMGLPVEEIPLFGCITRLAGQKGIDIMVQSLDEILCETRMQVAILGSGEDELARSLNNLQKKYSNCVFINGYDNSLAHLIKAAADFYLMPSRFEPCGLNQLYSFRYGTLPIVHGVGGLNDTVEQIDRESGNGFKMNSLTSEKLISAINRALEFFVLNDSFKAARKRIMKLDYSWTAPARSYQKLYHSHN